MILHAKYQSFMPYGFRQKYFIMFSLYKPMRPLRFGLFFATWA